MKYTWKCAQCGIVAEHVSAQADHYRAGFEIHSEHRLRSPDCTNITLPIFPGDAQAIISSKEFQDEIGRVRAIGGVVEIAGNSVALYRGILSHYSVNVFADRLKKLDPISLLDIIVATKDRP